MHTSAVPAGRQIPFADGRDSSIIYTNNSRRTCAPAASNILSLYNNNDVYQKKKKLRYITKK